MTRIYGLGLGALLLSSMACHAGPCSSQIIAAQAQIDARLDSAAGAGRTGPESTAATAHHQPTPKSIAEAEVKLGDVSQAKVQKVGEAMARARKADLAGDKSGCEKALSEVRRVIGE